MQRGKSSHHHPRLTRPSILQKSDKDRQARLYLHQRLLALRRSLATVLGKELREAIEKGEIARVRDLVRVGANIENMNDRNGLTAMHYASSYGHKNIIEILLDSGANIHAYDAKKATPLHSAASGGYSDITRLLLDRGAVIDEKDEHGWTPFHKAARNGHVSVVRELLESGADINAQGPKGRTALHTAAFDNKEDIVSLLLAADETAINVWAKKNRGRTALDLAKEKGHSEVIALLEKPRGTGKIDSKTAVPVTKEEGKKKAWQAFFSKKQAQSR